MADKKKRYGLVDRELSWLSFNARVLQEARDPRVPLYERLKFLSIYSSNLDEFFRVRVASLRTLVRVNEMEKATNKLGIDPRDLLRQIHETVTAQQEQFGATFRGEILPELADHGVFLIDESDLTEEQAGTVESYFEREVRPYVDPVVLGHSTPPFLEDRGLYLAVELYPKGHAMDVAAPEIGLVAIPSPPVDRFVRLPTSSGRNDVMFVDDVVRHHLPFLYPDHHVGGSYAVKLSRDADLYLDDEYAGSIAEQIRKNLDRRERGFPCRFLYDLHAPYHVISYLRSIFDLEDEDLVLGGRYHNLHDLAGFPRFDLQGVTFESKPPLSHPELEHAESMIEAIRERDRLVHFPYQKFDYVVRFLEEAVDDPEVESIWATLYRTSSRSQVVGQLIRAAEAGKQVTAFVEVKARFDEASNLEWADRMEAAGVRTLYSFRDLKVHAKLLLVGRREEGSVRWYGYLGTGNLNEVTARVYADHGLFTADARLAVEVRRVFAFLSGEEDDPQFDHLLVAPFTLRSGTYDLIDREVQNVREDRRGHVLAKMNALEDKKMIRKLYDASEKGVDVELIVRGICCLVPGVPGQSDRIRVRSIVDRFLEHARIYVFHNNGETRMYLASADWMTRNLSKRVEVAFPIYDDAVRQELLDIMDLQRRDSVKARIIDASQQNEYVGVDDEGIRAQMETYDMLKARWESSSESNRVVHAAGGEG